MTLEYRVNNRPAARLYQKVGFAQTRICSGYYHDTGEDAVELAIDDLDKAGRRQQLLELWEEWRTRYGYEVEMIL